ncbi:glycosyltransferase [Cellulomonas sp. S1-8]|uniref:glycosyltransferase n=1 Tax=Cellulomonas sp. S1-8 TaxID=2904790 RepID=UPI0022444FDD|nr:glycosyltransferase [Cellulomonas sp. S1-8]UZN01906.1 glycosyltransferase [Cellulomonas sp. S1-8]
MTGDGSTAPRVSVCMATFRGARWVEEQIASILAELGPDDELVVVDDASDDATPQVLARVDDPRVRIVLQHENRGYVRTFESALRAARGDVLLLADQDDVWVPGRLARMVDDLAVGDVVATNLATLGGPDAIPGPYGQSSWRLRGKVGGRRVRDVLGVLAGNRPYFGCAMGVRRGALDTLLPFPPFLVESHDLWIALYGNLTGTMVHDEAVSVLRRYHDDNTSPARPRGVRAALGSRLLLLRCLVELRRRGRALRG